MGGRQSHCAARRVHGRAVRGGRGGGRVSARHCRRLRRRFVVVSGSANRRVHVFGARSLQRKVVSDRRPRTPQHILSKAGKQYGNRRRKEKAGKRYRNRKKRKERAKVWRGPYFVVVVVFFIPYLKYSYRYAQSV